MRNQSLLEDDDEMYEEYDAQLRETEKNLNKASAKLAETMRQWEAENELKQARDTADQKAQIKLEFDNRKAQRETDMEQPKTAWEQAKTAL